MINAIDTADGGFRAADIVHDGAPRRAVLGPSGLPLACAPPTLWRVHDAAPDPGSSEV